MITVECPHKTKCPECGELHGSKQKFKFISPAQENMDDNLNKVSALSVQKVDNYLHNFLSSSAPSKKSAVKIDSAVNVVFRVFSEHHLNSKETVFLAHFLRYATLAAHVSEKDLKAMAAPKEDDRPNYIG